MVISLLKYVRLKQTVSLSLLEFRAMSTIVTILCISPVAKSILAEWTERNVEKLNGKYSFPLNGRTSTPPNGRFGRRMEQTGAEWM